MHNWNNGKLNINYNSDLSGEISLRNEKTKEEIEVDGESIVKFVLDHLLREKISKLENMSHKELIDHLV